MENQQTNFPLSHPWWPQVNSHFWGQPGLPEGYACLSLPRPIPLASKAGESILARLILELLD